MQEATAGNAAAELKISKVRRCEICKEKTVQRKLCPGCIEVAARLGEFAGNPYGRELMQKALKDHPLPENTSNGRAEDAGKSRNRRGRHPR